MLCTVWERILLRFARSKHVCWKCYSMQGHNGKLLGEAIIRLRRITICPILPDKALKICYT